MQLISEHNYYKSKGTLTDGKYFYSTVEHIQEETTLSKHEQLKCIQALIKLNIITVSLMGIPAKRHFKINFKAIADIFEELETKIKNDKVKKEIATQLYKISTTRKPKISHKDI